MYLDFYNLKTEPFSLSPDPKFLFLSESHKEALAYLRYGLIQQKGFVVITGEVGTGKTTLLFTLFAEMPQKVELAFISNPALSKDEFFALLAEKYKLGQVKDKADFLIRFTRFLENSFLEKKEVVLIVDEAHCLNEDVLQEIRLLSNIETPEAKLLNIILTGQPEFEHILAQPRFRSLKQRITLKYTLKPLNLDETISYIQFRLAKAGAKDINIFTEDAYKKIFSYSKGIPRLINVLCDRALLTGFVNETRQIDEKIIDECIAEIGDNNNYLATSNKESQRAVTTSRGKTFKLLATAVVILILVVVVLICCKPGYLGEYHKVLDKILEFLGKYNG
ncbi:MAG: AAA family ATPase [Thermodesulfobacteria bacterium]|nr:AAA family ATPase [Thermodesulfobacteriota bacterium]